MNFHKQISAAASQSNETAALLLQTWLSPAFPVGGFAYSHGLEAAVENGDVGDAASLRQWLLDLLEHGSVRNDVILMSAAWRAAACGDRISLASINELALAMSPSRERRLETVSQGAAFMAAAGAAYACDALDVLAGCAGGDVAYPVAVAAAASGHKIPLLDTCGAWAQAFVSALVSSAVRLGPIGQTEAQKIIATLIPAVVEVSRFAVDSTLDDLGGASIRSDIASMRHETQYSRLFRS